MAGADLKLIHVSASPMAVRYSFTIVVLGIMFDQNNFGSLTDANQYTYPYFNRPDRSRIT